MEFEKKNEVDQSKIKKEKWNKIFPSLCISFLLFLISFLYWILIEYSNDILFFFLSFLSLLIGIAVFKLLTIKIKKDLVLDEIKLMKTKVENKTHKTIYEAISGRHFIPILGDIFSKVKYGQELRKIELYILQLNGEKFYVSKDIYDKIEEAKFLYIRQTINSNIYLGIKLK